MVNRFLAVTALMLFAAMSTMAWAHWMLSVRTSSRAAGAAASERVG